MLSKEMVDVANKQIQIEIAESNEQLQKKIASSLAKFNARGALAGGGSFSHTLELCCDHLEYQITRAWMLLHRVLLIATAHPYTKIADDLKELLAYHFNDLSTLESIFTSKDHFWGPSLRQMVKPKLEAIRILALTKIGLEVDLFVMNLKKLNSQNDAQGNIFHIYAPIGAIQTGSHASTNINQKFDSAGIDRLVSALDTLKDFVSKEESLSANSAEIIELIDEIKEETSKEKPNTGKICGLISVVASSVQMIANARPAYQTLKAAAAYFGIMLP